MSVHQNVEPIRPGGGLRRLRKGDFATRSASPACSYPQLIAKLNADIERSSETDDTLVLVKLSFKPLPGTVADAAKAHHLPEEVLERVTAVHHDVRIAVLSPSEAMVLVSGVKRRADGEQLASALVTTLRAPIVLDGVPHHLSPTVGAAVLDQENATVDDLLEAARLAFVEADPAKAPVVMFHPYQRVWSRHRAKASKATSSPVVRS
ncbi:MAG: hypothetical protein AAGK32_05650 [Actinomycetota bacterium]